MADVKITGLHKDYGAVPAVRGIDLEIRDGEFTVLVGPSGCGKSTLLRTIAGLEEASDGTIEIGGEVVNDFRPRDRDVAMVFQDYALYPHMNVAKNIGFGLKARRMPKAEVDARVAEAARMLGITPLLGRYPAPALRRPAPARRHRPRHRAQPAGLPVRRAALQPRRPAPRRDARRDQAAAPGDRHHDDLRHPRPDRGDDARRPDRADARRRDRAAGRAARALRAPGLDLRRRLPRLAADELPARHARARTASDRAVRLGDTRVPIAPRPQARRRRRRPAGPARPPARAPDPRPRRRRRRRARSAATPRSSSSSRPARAATPPSASPARRWWPSCRRTTSASPASRSRSTST